MEKLQAIIESAKALVEKMSWQNVTEVNGMALAVTGMAIVFVALTVIATFIAILPHVLVVLAKVMPESEEGHEAPRAAAPDDGMVAAMGYILYKKKLGEE